MDLPIERRRGLVFKLAIAFALLVVALLAFSIPSVSRWLGSELSVQRSMIRSSTVVQGDLVREVAVEGRVVAAFHPTVFAPQPGIVSVLVKAGTVVAENDEVARVASPELESELRQERSAYDSAAAELARQQIVARQQLLANEQTVALREVVLEAAQRAMDRAEHSRQLGIVNQVDFETAQDELQVAAMQLEHAKRSAKLENESLDFETRDRGSRLERQRMIVVELERQVDALRIRAPVAGLVSRVHVEDREAVNRNAPLVTVVDLTAFEIEIAIAESDADEILPGTPVEVTADGASYAGSVHSIAPEVQGSRVRGRVVFDQEIPAGLKQNQRVQALLRLETRPGVLKVARGPFLEAGGGRQAYRIDGELAVLVPIEVGTVSVTEVEIRAGLDIGDEIVISDTTRFEGASKVLLR